MMAEQIDKKARIEWIDALRGFAILLVVMGHIYDKGFRIEGTSFNNFYNGFHMPLFFFISGCFFKSCDIKNFCFKKLRRLWQPILMLEIVPVIMMGNFDNLHVGWFPPTLITVTILFYLVFNVSVKVKPDNPIVLGLFCLAIWGFLDFMYIRGINFPFFLNALKMFPFFTLGYLWMKYPVIHKLIFNKYVLGGSLMGYALFMYNFAWNHTISIVAIFAIIILINYFKDIKNRHLLKYFSLLGTCSFEIYYFHMLFVPDMHNLAFYILDNYAFVFALIITLCLAVVITQLVLFIIKMLKQSCWLHSLLFGK